MPRVIKSYHQRLVVFLTFAVSERETETETERDRETDGERQRETERERERGEREWGKECERELIPHK